MKEEYTCETYPSIGKKYNGEKAIISLTSWKARINTVSKTLFNLIKMCPGFHIVLVLSEEEFPQKEKNLPSDLILFVNNKLIEILWVSDNIKSHKKYFYTMQKYKSLPIILADDDLIYTENFAQKLYNTYLIHKDKIICSRCHFIKKEFLTSYNKWDYESKYIGCNKHLFFTSGAGTLFPPNCLKLSNVNLVEIKKCIYADDIYLNVLALRNNIQKYSISTIMFKEYNDKCIKQTALSLQNCTFRNDEYLKMFYDDFKKILNEYNIIGNSCASAYLNKSFLLQKYNNPFVWNIIDYNSMYNLITKFDFINFNNFKLIKQNNLTYSILIDDLVKLDYEHYKYNPEVDKKITESDEGLDFESKNIETYIKDKYIERIERMKNQNIDPIFICGSRDLNAANNYSIDEINNILNIQTKYKIIICSEFNIDFTNTENKEFIHIKTNIGNNGLPLATYIANNSSILKQII